MKPEELKIETDKIHNTLVKLKKEPDKYFRHMGIIEELLTVFKKISRSHPNPELLAHTVLETVSLNDFSDVDEPKLEDDGLLIDIHVEYDIVNFGWVIIVDLKNEFLPSKLTIEVAKLLIKLVFNLLTKHSVVYIEIK